MLLIRADRPEGSTVVHGEFFGGKVVNGPDRQGVEMKPSREQLEQALLFARLKAIACEDVAEEARLTRKLEALNRRPERPDITSLAPFPVTGGPKLAWGSMPSEADKRRRDIDRRLRKFGVLPKRWV